MTPLFGPNSVLVLRFIHELEGWSLGDLARFRHAWVRSFASCDVDARRQFTLEHATAVIHAIDAALDNGRGAAYFGAMAAATDALRPNASVSPAVARVAVDLAGLLVVRDLLDDADFTFFNGPWRAAFGRDAGGARTVPFRPRR